MMMAQPSWSPMAGEAVSSVGAASPAAAPQSALSDAAWARAALPLCSCCSAWRSTLYACASRSAGIPMPHTSLGGGSSPVGKSHVDSRVLELKK